MFKLGAKIDSSFGKSFAKAQRQINNTGKQATHAEKAFKKADRMLKGLAATAAGYISITAVKDFLSSSVEAAKESIDASTKLHTVMKNTKGVTDQQVNGLEKYAEIMQKKGVIEGDTLVAGMQMAGTFQLQAKTIETLTPGMADLLAQQKGLNATQEDAVGVGKLIGKVMTGQTGALKKVGVNFTKTQERVLKYGTEQEKAAMLSKVLQQNVGGVNAALRNTDQGRIQAAANAWGDMKEVLGAALLPELAKYATMIENHIPEIQTTLKNAIETGINVFKKIGEAISWARKNASWLIPVVSGLVAAITTFKIISTVIGLINAWKTAQIALNISMSANPIGVVIVSIGLLVAAGVALYQNWDKVAAFMDRTWRKIKDIFIRGINWVIDKVNALIERLNNIPGVDIPVIARIQTEAASSGDFRQLEGKNARGTSWWRGGATWVGERGPELVNLPRGTAIRSNQRSLSDLDAALSGRGSSVPPYNPTVIIRGNADEASVTRALDLSFEKWKKYAKKYEAEKKRLQFSPA
jgi:hypothetical protein